MTSTLSFPTPPEPKTADEYANSITAFAVAQHLQMASEGAKAQRASDIARDAVTIFADRTTSASSSATSEAIMAKCVELAKLARSLAEK